LFLGPLQYELVFDLLCAEAEALASQFDARSLDACGAADAVRALGLVLRLVQGMLGQAANRAHDTAAYLATGERDAPHFVANAVGVSTNEARRVIATASQLESLPATAAAVSEGRLSALHAELIAQTAAAHPESEKRLLTAAKLGTAALKDACLKAQANSENPAQRSKRQHASRTLRMWTAADGMVEGKFRLTPEIGGQVKAVIDAGVQKIFRDRHAGEHEFHDAYAANVFADAFLGDSTAKGVKHNVHIIIDYTALQRGNTIDGERCEIPGVGPINVEYVRGLLGDAFLTAIIGQGRDIRTVAHLGRHVPAEVKTAMLVGGRECDVEGCECRNYLELDHSEVDFAAGGPTAYWNLTWLCSVHHRRKSSGWVLGPRNPYTGKRPLRPPGSVEQ
jgi:hypothetical protein